MTARRPTRPPRGACGRTSGRQTHRVDIKSRLAYPIRRFERAGSISTTTRARSRSIACRRAREGQGRRCGQSDRRSAIRLRLAADRAIPIRIPIAISSAHFLRALGFRSSGRSASARCQICEELGGRAPSLRRCRLPPPPNGPDPSTATGRRGSRCSTLRYSVTADDRLAETEQRLGVELAGRLGRIWPRDRPSAAWLPSTQPRASVATAVRWPPRAIESRRGHFVRHDRRDSRQRRDRAP